MNTPWLGTFIKDGILTNLTPLIKASRINMAQYYPQLVAMHSKDDKIYGLPKDWDTIALYYNKAYFNKLHLAVPANLSWNADGTGSFVLARREVGRDGRAGRSGYRQNPFPGSPHRASQCGRGAASRIRSAKSRLLSRTDRGDCGSYTARPGLRLIFVHDSITPDRSRAAAYWPVLVCGAADRNGDFQSGIPPGGSLMPGTAGRIRRWPVAGSGVRGPPFHAVVADDAADDSDGWACSRFAARCAGGISFPRGLRRPVITCSSRPAYPRSASTWIAEIGPAPHEWFATSAKLASWAGLAPGNYVSAGKRRYGRTGMAGGWIKPALVEAAWAAVRHPGRIQARYHALVRRMGGAKNPAARKKALVAIAHTLLKIAWAILKSGQPYEEPGPDFYARRENPARRQAWLEAQIQKLYPGCVVTVTVTPPPDDPGPGDSPPPDGPVPSESPPPAAA